MTGPMLRNAVLLAGIAATVGLALGATLAPAEPASAATVAQPQNPPPLCYHTGVSDWVCPDSSARNTSAAFMRYEDITRVEVIVTTRAGRRSVIFPAGVDAVFLTREATEKFLLSYYWAVNKDKALGLTRALSSIR